MIFNANMEKDRDIFLYEELTGTPLETLGLVWTGNNYYKEEHVSDDEIAKLKDLTATKVRFEGAGSNRDLYDQLFEKAHNMLKELVFSSEVPSYVILVEADLKTKNRIRSHKGILPKEKLIKDSFVEFEFDYGGANSSLFLGAAVLNSENFSLLVNKIGDNRKGFVFQTLKPVLSKMFLEEVFYNCLDNGLVNYRKLIIKLLVNKDERIYRIGGDGGDQNLDIDTFFKRTNNL